MKLHVIFQFLISILGILFFYIDNIQLTSTINFLFFILIFFNIINNIKNLFSVIYFWLFLILFTLIPLYLLKIDFIQNIIFLNDTRELVFNEQNIDKTFNILMISLFTFSIFLNFSQSLSLKNINKTKNYILELLILLVTYLVNQRSQLIFFDNYSGDGYIEGVTFGGWPIIFICLMALYIYRTSLSTRRSYIFSFFVILIWFAFGNRGEIFPLIFFIILSSSQKNNYNLLKISMFFFIGVVAFFYLGLLRAGINLIDKDVIYVIISNFTGSHILYTMLSIVYHVDIYGLDYGGTILDYVVRAIPSFIYSDRPGDLSRFLVDNYESGGGTHFFGEMYYNFGVLGVYIQAITFGILLTYIQNK